MKDREENIHLVRLKKGNIESFKWLYRFHYEKVYHFCLALCHSPPDAEEITSDVFVKVWEKRKAIDSSLSLKFLLFKITRDLSWNYLKRTARNERLSKEFLRNYQRALTVDGEVEVLFGEYLNILNEAVNKLTPQQQKVFTLRYITGRELNQIASELSISKNTVKVHLASSKRAVLAYLELHADVCFTIMAIYFLSYL